MLVCQSRAWAAQVQLAEESYEVAPGGVVRLAVEIDYAAGEAGTLFSYGVRLVPDSVAGVSVVGITAEEELDFNGVFGAGAQTDTDLAVLGAKGTIDIAGFPGNEYGGERLVVFELRFDEVGEFELGLDFFRTAGEREDVFIDGAGESLDGGIAFRGAVVRVGEPAVDKAEVGVGLVRAGDGFELRFDDPVGFEFVIEESGDLREWSEVVRVVGDGGRFVRAVGVEGRRRCFRVGCSRLPP